MDEQFKTNIKSFWQKPEGKTGAVFGVGILALIGWGFWTILPFLIAFAASTLNLIFLLLASGALIYIVLDKKVRTLVWYMYKVAMKKITGMVIEIDPIAILKAFISSLQENRANMDTQIGTLFGSMKKLDTLIKNNASEIAQNIKLAGKAKEMGKNAELIVKTRKAGRLQNSNVTYKNLYVKMELCYRVLSKMYENTGYMLEDTIDEVKVKEEEYKAIKASSSALKSAMAIINGDSDKKEIYEQALQTIADQVGQKVGEMERFMEISKTFMDSIDLQQGVFEEDGLKMLEQWEKEADSTLLGGDKQYLIELANNDSAVLNLSAENQEKIPSKKKGDNKYKDLY